MQEILPQSHIPVLECRNLSISYFTRAGEIPAVVDFNLKLMPGEAHGIVGESGCGKSTIALAIMQYLGRNGRIVSGQILYEGRDLVTMDREALRKVRGSKIAMVYQEPMASLNPSLRIGEQLAEVLIYHEGVGRQQAMTRARAMLERVKLSDSPRIMRAYPHQISGGQQQRIVIAMALLARPRLLLLDEPTTALDVTVEAGIVDLIRDIASEFGMGLIYISHNLGLIRETCDRITVMYSGQAIEHGSIIDVFARPRHPYTSGLFHSIPLPGMDKNDRPMVGIPGQLPPAHLRPSGCTFGPRCTFFLPGVCERPPALEPVAAQGSHAARCWRLGEIDPGRDMQPSIVKQAAEIGGIVLRFDGLSKRYGRVHANTDLTFDARTAETVAIVGESGCGKSTLARILIGLETADTGSATLNGVDLARRPVTRRDKLTVRGLQMIFQNPFDTLNPSHTIGFQIARVIRKFGVETDKTKIDARVLELLDKVKLPLEFATRRPRQLSGGQKQRVGIARAFAGSPTLVVADEPVSALDVSVQATIAELLMDIQRVQRTTLLFISHDLGLVRYIADRVVVMYLGKIMETGRTADIFAAPYHPYTEALISAVPVADPRFIKRRVVLSGELPSPSDPPKGCPFSTRCGRMIAGLCDRVPPPVHEFDRGHRILCHLSRETLLAMEPIITMRAGPLCGVPATTLPACASDGSP